MAPLDTKTKALQASGSFNPRPERVKAPWFQNSAFFDPRDFLQVKYEMLRQVSIEGASKSEAAALFGVSRPTFYEAESAFLREGFTGLLPQQRGPQGAHKLDANMMRFIEKCIHENQTLHTPELVLLIQAHFNISVHPRSIERAMARKKKVRNKSR